MPPIERPKPQKVDQLAEMASAQLLADLQEDPQRAFMNYLGCSARFHRYSWTNMLLIGSQRPSATRVAGYHAWHRLGRSVKEGEKGIVIYASPKVTATRAVEQSLISGGAIPSTPLTRVRRSCFRRRTDPWQAATRLAHSAGRSERVAHQAQSDCR